MADNKLGVAAGLQVLHSQFFGYFEANNQGFARIRFIIYRGGPEVKSMLDDIPLEDGKD